MKSKMLSLLLIWVLHFHIIAAFVTPPKLSHQSQFATDQDSFRRSRRYQRLMVREFDHEALTSIGIPNIISSKQSIISTDPDDVVLASINRILEGGHSPIIQQHPTSLQTTGLVADLTSEFDAAAIAAQMQNVVQQLPDATKAAIFAVLAVLVVYQATNQADDDKKISNESSITSVDKKKNIEAAVADLSQTVVVLTNEIKAIKATTDAPRKLKELELQNAALQQELQNTMVKARTLNTQQKEIHSGLQINGVLEREARQVNGAVAADGALNGQNTTGRLKLNEQENNDDSFHFSEDEGGKNSPSDDDENSDLLFAATIFVILGVVLSNI